MHISLDGNFHQVGLRLGVPELMTSNLVPFIIFVALDNTQLCCVSKPYYSMVAMALLRKVYDEIGHG
jgi:hypothetical protein